MAAQATTDQQAVIRVLCVDDDRDFRDLVQIYLDERRDDISVQTAPDGEAVLGYLERGRYDCVVSDYRMPGMDGLTLLDAVRQAIPDLPFILFTGRGGEDVAAEAVSAGVTDYIRKSPDPEQFDLLANRIRNVVERHRARVQYQAIFDSVSEAVLVIDTNEGAVVDANRRAGELWDCPTADLVGRPLDTLRDSGESAESGPWSASSTGRTPSQGRSSMDSATGTPGGGAQGVATSDDSPKSVFSRSDSTLAVLGGAHSGDAELMEWRCRRRDGTEFWAAVSRKMAEIDGRQRSLVIVRDVTRRKVHQQQLDRLLWTVRDLLVVPTEAQIVSVVEETTTQTLRFETAEVYLLDDDAAEFFHLNADGDDLVAIDEGAPVREERLWEVLGGDGIVGVDAEANAAELNRSAQDDPEAIASSGDLTLDRSSHIYIPIGELGVLDCIASEATDLLDVELAALLATFAAGAFDRARREALLREREETLVSQRDELLSLDHVNAVIRDINRALVSVSSREGIERLVCEKFASTDAYGMAWMGEVDTSERSVSPTATAGQDAGFLPERVNIGASGDDPMSTAVDDRAVTVVDRITPETLPPERYRLARDRGFEAVAFVPIVHQNVLYRLLTLYSVDPDVFGDRERAVLGELGETIGLALAAAEWRSSRVSDTLIELELTVQDDSGLFALTAETDGELELRDMRETDEGLLRVFGRLSGTDFETFAAAVTAAGTLEEPVLLAAREGASRVGYVIRSGPLMSAITQGGISLQSGTISGGDGHFRLSTPVGTDVRWVVEQFSAAFDAVELVGRRDRYRTETVNRFDDLLDSLTARQQEVVRLAYHAGYFETPRQVTGTEVARLLEVSQPTFNEHLRNAERQLIEGLLET